jgi:hypothetical protein
MLKANCPSCGASISFQSTYSILAVCEHCNSTIVRHDLNVEDIGKMATLQVDASPIQIGTRGEYRGVSFSVVGRIQLRFDRGLWNEWHLMFGDGRSGWLGEAQGTYAVSFLEEVNAPLPGFEELKSRKKVVLQKRDFHVENVERARCIGGQGELPFRVAGGYDAPVADLVGEDGAFATIDYSEEHPLVFIGEYVEFDDLRLTNLREFDSWTNKAKPKVKSFQCVQCGSPIPQRAFPQTLSVICPSCGCVIDVSNENLKAISTFVSKVKVTPLIPLGTRGMFKDGEFEVIGFLRRFITVEGVDYWWHEYLLFNPYKGFRWLSEYNGHWSYIRSTLRRPKIIGNNDVHFDGEVFEHFQSATAKVDYVIGEFYWRVQYGESCIISDFIAPPRMLSVERTDNEMSYSLGEYMTPAQLVQAFDLKSSLPPQIGVGAIQPSPYKELTEKVGMLTLLFLTIAVAIQIVTLALAQDKLVYQTNLAYKAGESENSRVSEIFELKGRPSNVMVRTNANVNNSWIYVSMALINDDTGTAYDFGREIGYYSGSDSDGSWTEGSRSDDVFLPSIPAGHYYLRVEPEGAASTSYSIEIYRDVPRWWLFLATVAVLLLIPMAAVWKKRNFEFQRWSESDHPKSKLIKFEGDDE